MRSKNACNGLSGQILQRVLETEFKSSSMLVTIAGTEFRIHNCGSQATVEGLKHTNLCFYLSATADVRYEEGEYSVTRDKAEAVALKSRLSALANAQPLLGSKGHNFDAASQLAEWPVFYAYAKLVGPICVASEASQVTTLFSVVTGPSKTPVDSSFLAG